MKGSSQSSLTLLGFTNGGPKVHRQNFGDMKTVKRKQDTKSYTQLGLCFQKVDGMKDGERKFMKARRVL